MNSEKKHLIQSSISSYESNNQTIAAVPTVIEQSGRGERAFDIYSRLLRERIIFLGTGINDQAVSYTHLRAPRDYAASRMPSSA